MAVTAAWTRIDPPIPPPHTPPFAKMQITSWEQAYVDEFTPWDRGEPSPPLAEWFTRHTITGRVLVPGCGLGHDVAHLATLGLDAVGLDIAPTAISRARQLYPQLAERFVCEDLFQHEGHYDAVVEHTCLCALTPDLRVQYRDAMARLLRPGGLLIGIWFINPELDPGETGPPFGITPDELAVLFAPSFEIIENYVPETGYPSRQGRELLRVMQRRA